MARSHSVVCKMVLIVAVAANLLSFSAGQAALPSSPPDGQYPDCNSSPTMPECDTCCRKAGHPGGYVKGDVCICNSG